MGSLSKQRVVLRFLLAISVVTACCVREATAAPPPATRTPLVRVVDLRVGESRAVELCDGTKAQVKLLRVEENRDAVRSAVRASRVTIEVNSQRAVLTSATYHLPVKVAGVQVDCPITRGYLANSSQDAWGLVRDARLRLWPAGSPWVAPGTFAYPVKQRWFASDTQMANEPTFVNGDEQPSRRKIYYHYGLDFGGAEGMVDVIAATDGLVVSRGTDVLPGCEGTPVRPRYDVVYLLDDRGWYCRYSHLRRIDPAVKLGQRVKMRQNVGVLGKEGASGGWSHLHFDIQSRQPSGKWGTQAAYAFVWEAYRREYSPTLVAVARPHHLAWTGEPVTLDGMQSWSAAGKIARYDWTFTDGTRASGPTVERAYARPGTYSEILKVTDEHGRVAYDFAVVQVIDRSQPGRLPPTIHAAYAPTFDIKPGDPVTFKVRTFRTTSGRETWDFGDGAPPVTVKSDGNVNPHAKDGYAVTTHRFSRPGDYLVRVERSDQHGQKATAHLHVRVGRPDAVNMPQTEVTTVNITDKVLVKDTVRLGINLGGDAYYSGAALVKKRVQENFEGTSYRQCHFGPLQDERGATTWFRDWGTWDKILKGTGFTILSGPAKGITGTIRDIGVRKAMHEGKEEEFRYFVFDREVPTGPPNVGILVETFRLRDGQFRSLDGFWTSKSNHISIGDVPPGSFGCAAACLDATGGKAHLRFSTHYQRYGQTNGAWKVRFWARAKSGSPRLAVFCDRSEFGESRGVELTPDWRKHELTLVARNVPEPKSPDDNPMLFFRFESTGGAVLLDDVEIWMGGDTNPTAFRDDCVETLKRFHPGVIRRLQMGGSTVANTLAPILRSHTYTSRNGAKATPYQSHSKDSYSLHEMYELCEYLGADPWCCLPGTLNYDEIEKFMEYIGAPPDVGYGKLRAELGHPEPWTDVFKTIHVEFGNEAWNNAGSYQCGGFNGEDYWKDLIALGKKSPYYKSNVIFHAGGQAANSWLGRAILGRVPNADRYSVAPYILHRFTKSDAETLDTDDKLFRWAFAYPIWRSRNQAGAMFQNYELAKKAGIEMSIYEMNHHITGGDGPLEPRNKIVTSIGGGINVVNTMLLMMKEHQIRTQCLFSLAQHSYNAHGVGPVRLWGTALNMRKGHQRYRPTFLACAIVNKVIAGDLVETVHDGFHPTFAATGVFNRRKGTETIRNIPTVFSYAFAEKKKRALILINLDTSKKHPVAIRFTGNVVKNLARSWLLTANEITANNEFEMTAPQVKIREESIAGFASGTRLVLPPFSMQALAWELK